MTAQRKRAPAVMEEIIAELHKEYLDRVSKPHQLLQRKRSEKLLQGSRRRHELRDAEKIYYDYCLKLLTVIRELLQIFKCENGWKRKEFDASESRLLEIRGVQYIIRVSDSYLLEVSCYTRIILSTMSVSVRIICSNPHLPPFPSIAAHVWQESSEQEDEGRMLNVLGAKTAKNFRAEVLDLCECLKRKLG